MSDIWGIAKIFLFWRLGLLAVTYLGSFTFPLSSNGGLGAPTVTKPFDFWLSWAQWDGGHFYTIAQRGYQLMTDYAFFPLYPLLIKISTKIFPQFILPTGLLISNLSFLLFLIIFFKFVEKRYRSEVAYNSLVSILVFPTAFFAVSFYSEGLFLFLSVLVFYFLYRKNLLLSSIFALLAATTRVAGIFLTIPLFYNYFWSISYNIKNLSSKAFIPFISTFGFALWAIYLFAKTNDPLRFVNTQTLWQRSASDPLSTIIGNLWILITSPKLPFDQYFDLGITLLFLGILIWGVKKIPSSLWIFSILVILLPLSSGTLTSMPRYALGSLGAFIAIGRFLEDHPKFRFPLWGASLVLQAILAVRFINGYWVA
ncbi:hypothetical protein HYZ70_01370 [Candidatus Curtissbacteria bacterium]|nr:hypothetical protein [Candidatus Curtissbacteria bacterium]